MNLLHSPEAIDRVVKSDYLAYLGREADDVGLADWRARLQAGATFGAVAVGLLGSQEFFDHAGQNLSHAGRGRPVVAGGGPAR